MPTLPTLTYLANTITANDKTIPYSTIMLHSRQMTGRICGTLFTPIHTEADRFAYQQADAQGLKKIVAEKREEHKKLEQVELTK